MAYRFQAGKPVLNEIRRLVREELKSAGNQLSGGSEDGREQAIHEARKSLKKIRAVLRLVRAQIGDTYTVENVRMRDAGRRMSVYRDADVMIETFDHVLEKYRVRLGEETLEAARQHLVDERDRQVQDTQIEPLLRDITAELRRSEKRIAGWRLTEHGFDAIEPGLERSYRSGRKAMALAQKHPRDENYHEWRKRAKDLWYHVRLLEDMWTDILQAYEHSLKNLQEWLGDDHNLVVLRDRVLNDPRAFGTAAQTDLLLGLISEYQNELRAESLDLGRRIYEEKPRDFLARMRGLWRAWQSAPEGKASGSPEE